MMTSRNPIIGNSNKPMRLDDKDDNNNNKVDMPGGIAMVASDDSGNNAEKLSSFRSTSTSPKHHLNNNEHQQQQMNKRAKISSSSSSDDDDHKSLTLSAKYQAALRRIVELETKQQEASSSTSTSTGVNNRNTSPFTCDDEKNGDQQVIAEDLVATRLHQMKSVLSNKPSPATATATATSTLTTTKSVVVTNKAAAEEQPSKPASTITSYLPMCPTTNTANSKSLVCQLTSTKATNKKKQQDDASALQLARMIF